MSTQLTSGQPDFPSYCTLEKERRVALRDLRLEEIDKQMRFYNNNLYERERERGQRERGQREIKKVRERERELKMGREDIGTDDVGNEISRH